MVIPLFSLPVTQSELYRTCTVKKDANPTFGESTFTSEELPRSLLKDGCLKLRIMNESKYANDICLSEVIVALKKVDPLDVASPKDMSDCDLNNNGGSDEQDKDIYVLYPCKEVGAITDWHWKL